MNTNKGFSLIEVLVVIGVMSVMSFFMMDMINNQNKAMKTIQNAIDLNDVQARVQRYMLDLDICKNSLDGYSFAPDNSEVTISSIKKNATTVLISSSPPDNKIGGVEIESLKITRKPAPLDTELALTIRFKKAVSGTSYGGDYFVRTVNLAAQFSPTAPNTVTSCYSQLDNAIVVTAVRQACLQICPTCTWDATNNVCKQPAAAPSGQQQAAVPPPKLYVNPIDGGVTTNPVYRFTDPQHKCAQNPPPAPKNDRCPSSCPAGSSAVGNSSWSGGTQNWSICYHSQTYYCQMDCKLDQSSGTMASP